MTLLSAKPASEGFVSIRNLHINCTIIILWFSSVFVSGFHFLLQGIIRSFSQHRKLVTIQNVEFFSAMVFTNHLCLHVFLSYTHFAACLGYLERELIQASQQASNISCA